MPPATLNAPRTSGLWTALHLATLVTIWAVYTLLGAYTTLASGAPVRLVAIGYGAFFCYSTILGFLFHRQIHQRNWLALPTAKALALIVGGVGAVGVIQASLVYLVQWLLRADMAPLLNARLAFYLWLNASIVTGITTLAYCTAAFFHRLSAAREQARALENNLNAARLSALEAQMNPHFLFNSLNSLRGMIVENPATAQDMVTRLANLLRHSLSRDETTAARLTDELELVQDYLSLEAVRFEDRLRVKIETEPEVASFLVPTLALQTLVENALKHGIAPLPEGGEISLSARRSGAGRWQLAVRSPGRIHKSTTDGTGTGLRNVRERLRLLFGEDASLTLTESDQGVTATLNLPALTAWPGQPDSRLGPSTPSSP